MRLRKEEITVKEPLSKVRKRHKNNVGRGAARLLFCGFETFEGKCQKRRFFFPASLAFWSQDTPGLSQPFIAAGGFYPRLP